MPRFSSGRIAIMWAWWGQFDCLIGGLNLDPDGGGVKAGNVSADLNTAINIKIWLERAAYKAGLESINLILLSALPQETPVELQKWQQRRVDEAMEIFEAKLRQVGWLEENTCIRENNLL